jgi:hypothetical protein
MPTLILILLGANCSCSSESQRGFREGLGRRRTCQDALVALQRSLRLIQRRLIEARIDLCQEVTLLDFLASWNPTSVSWPATWVCTVTVASGVTVPSALSVTGMSPVLAVAVTTGMAPERAKRPVRTGCGWGRSTTQASAATTSTLTSGQSARRHSAASLECSNRRAAKRDRTGCSALPRAPRCLYVGHKRGAASGRFSRGAVEANRCGEPAPRWIASGALFVAIPFLPVGNGAKFALLRRN